MISRWSPATGEALDALADEIARYPGRTAPRPLVLDYDLAAPEAPAAVEDLLALAGASVEILVNNAGYGLIGSAAESDRAAQLGMIDLNIRALTELSLRFSAHLIANKGRLLNVASVAAYMPGPGMAVYYASKAYVLSFTEALSKELEPHGVTVTALCPGPVPTGFGARAGFGGMMDWIKFFQLSPEAVAEAGLRRDDGRQARRNPRSVRKAHDRGHRRHAEVAAARQCRRRAIAPQEGGRQGMNFCASPSWSQYKPVLVVLHGEQSTPGRIGRLLRELGAPLDIRRPRFGDPLPENLEHHAGAVFFGGPMSANDEEDWLKREIDWLAAPLKENKPYLGICLGAQLLARQLGQKVDAHPEGKVEVGYYPIHPTEYGHELCESPFPTGSINGTARVLTAPRARCCSPRARISRRRRSGWAKRRSGSSSTRT